METRTKATLLVVSLFTAVTGVRAATVLASDSEIRAILAERVGAVGDGVGIVVGVVEPEGRRVISYGQISKGNPRPPDGETAFEIGSVTKVFTALLLADMVWRGEVALGDPVAKYLPAGVKIPRRNGRSITLLDLATHTSGLPFMPDEETTSAAQLYQLLARHELRRDIGAEREYSNLGYWLLGEALASRAGRDFESLVRRASSCHSICRAPPSRCRRS
jgi:CubicO group peptidase (beta-lactamase class C family)